jgi:hypothetical protein
MTGPLLLDSDVAALSEINLASMTHLAIRGTKVTTPGPGATRVDSWTYTATAVPARLNPLSELARERAGAPAAQQLYTLSLPRGTGIAVGDRWQVSGTTSDEVWTRTVLVSREVFPKHIETCRRAIVIDVVSNP